MNFQDLLQKMKELDEGIEAQDKYIEADKDVEEGNEFSGALAKAKASGQTEFEVDGKQYQVKEDGTVEECGGMMPSMSSMPPKQQDNVSMNVSMNGQGAGGIRDLMSILKNIEQGDSSDAKDVIVGMEEYANEPDVEVADIGAVIPTGDDLHSKGGEAPKVNGGGNPMQRGFSEGLLDQLNNLYQEVKLR